MQWLNLLQVEWLKTRRTFVLLMLFLAPMVTAIFPLIQHLDNGGSMIVERGWVSYWGGLTMMWCVLMLPMFCVLSCTLLVHSEHQNQSWRLKLTLPVSRMRLYVVKLFMAWGFILLANTILLCFGALSVWLMLAKGYPPVGAWDYPIFKTIALLSICALPMVAIQHAMAWRITHLLALLTLGLVTTLAISFAGRSKYWVYFPWDYPFISVNGNAELTNQAIVLSIVGGAVLVLITGLLLARRPS